MQPKLTIQIVTWNSAKHLPTTLQALKNMPASLAHVRIIDNGSVDDSVAMARSLLPQADIVTLPKNEGFAGAHNIGFAKCSTEFVLTHDPDLALNWTALDELLSVFEDEHVAAVQGKLYRREERDDRPVIDSAGISQTLTLNGAERGANEVDTGQCNAPEKLLAVTAACGLYRMSALKAVAYHHFEVFDDDFFAYKEDVDLGWRLKLAGYISMYEPIVIGIHARTLGERGSIPWFLNPVEAPKRIISLRSRYSIRNYVWMLVKNITWQEEIIYGLFIAIRLLYILLLTILFPYLFSVWLEIIEKLPIMIHKRAAVRS